MPAQCPECGRFLRNDLVTGLVEGPATCPKCGSELTASMFGLQADEPAGETVPTVAAAAPPGGGSTAAAGDPLEGWDQPEGTTPAVAREGTGALLALEPDEALLAGIGGGILGALVWRERPGLGSLVGAALGVIAGAMVRGARPRH